MIDLLQPQTEDPNLIDPNAGPVPGANPALGMSAVPAPSPIVAPAPPAPAPETMVPAFAQGPAPAPTPPTTNPAVGERQAIDDYTKAGVEKMADAEQSGRLQAKADLEHAAALEKKAADERLRQDAIDRQEAANQEARAKLAAVATQADEAVANHKFNDYFEGQGTGNKIGLLIGTFLSGLGGAKTNTILDAAISRDFEAQKAALTSKENLARLKHEGVRDFDSYLRDQRTVIEFKEKAARDAVADEMEAKALRSGNPLVIAKAKAEADSIRQTNAVGRAKLENDYVKSEEARAHARLLNHKAGGAGGVGGSAGKQQALAAALTKSGGEITPEVAAVADKMGIKPTDLRGMATNFKQERRVDLADKKAVAMEAAAFAKENKLPELTKTHQALTKINAQLNDPNADPLTQILALMEYDKASKGGTATQSSLNAALSHLAGGADKVDQFLEKLKTGGLSEDQKATLRASIHSALTATKEEVNTVHEAWNQTFRNMESYPDQKTVDKVSDLYFGSLGYKRGKGEAKPSAESKGAAPVDAHPSKEAVGATKVINGVTYEKVGPNNWQPKK